MNTEDIEYEIKATVYTGAATYGKIRITAEAFTFEYKNPHMGQPMFFPWSTIEKVEFNISVSRKINKEFTLFLETQVPIRFSTKETGKVLKHISDHIDSDKLSHSPSLLNAFTRNFKFHK